MKTEIPKLEDLDSQADDYLAKLEDGLRAVEAASGEVEAARTEFNVGIERRVEAATQSVEIEGYEFTHQGPGLQFKDSSSDLLVALIGIYKGSEEMDAAAKDRVKKTVSAFDDKLKLEIEPIVADRRTVILAERDYFNALVSLSKVASMVGVDDSLDDARVYIVTGQGDDARVFEAELNFARMYKGQHVESSKPLGYVEGAEGIADTVRADHPGQNVYVVRNPSALADPKRVLDHAADKLLAQYMDSHPEFAERIAVGKQQVH